MSTYFAMLFLPFRNIIPSSIPHAKKLMEPGYFTDDPLSQRIEILISPAFTFESSTTWKSVEAKWHWLRFAKS